MNSGLLGRSSEMCFLNELATANAPSKNKFQTINKNASDKRYCNRQNEKCMLMKKRDTSISEKKIEKCVILSDSCRKIVARFQFFYISFCINVKMLFP